MPSWTACTKWRCKCYTVVFHALPKCKISTVAFKRGVLYTLLFFIFILDAVGETKVLIITRCIKIDISIWCFVGMSFFDESINKTIHSLKALCSLWLNSRAFYSYSLHLLVESICIKVCNLFYIFFLLNCFFNDFIINIGNVSCILYHVAICFKQTS